MHCTSLASPTHAGVLTSSRTRRQTLHGWQQPIAVAILATVLADYVRLRLAIGGLLPTTLHPSKGAEPESALGCLTRRHLDFMQVIT